MLKWLNRFRPRSTNQDLKNQELPKNPISIENESALKNQLALFSKNKQWLEILEATENLAESSLSPSILYYRGLSLLHTNKAQAAIYLFDQALATDPENSDIYIALATAYLLLQDKEAAMDAALLGLHHAPNSSKAHLQIGHVYKSSGNLTMAMDHFRNAVELDKSNAEAHLAFANELHSTKDYQGAANAYKHAIELGRSSADILNNLGHALLSLEKYEESIHPLVESIRLNPHNSVSRINLGCSYRHVGMDDAAIEQFETVLRQQPNSYEARWYMCQIFLASAQWEKGWDQYECRFASEAALNRALPFKPWQGEDLRGKTVLIYAEQGVGDEMMFVSCLPDIIRQAGHCVLECNSRLVSLFQRSFPEITVLGCDHEYIPRWLPNAPKIDYQIALGSLPRVFRRQSSAFPTHIGYLKADSILTKKWQERLNACGTSLRVAISWRGGTAQTRTRSRSISPELLSPILSIPDIQFISLQYGKCDEDVVHLQSIAGANRVQHWQEAIEDFDETAALLMNVDVVITVCNTLVHLSGALGRPVWIMAPAVPEWRYLVSGDQLPWYPSSHIIRQNTPGEWEPVIKEFTHKLIKLSKN